MAFDIAAHLGAMIREVRNLEKDGQPAKAVIASRVYQTSPADLWDALTQPERLKRWFAPVSGDLQLGGRYHVEGNASGTVTACEPEKSMALTWEFGGFTSWVNLTLTPEEAGTELELEHIAQISPHWDQFGPGAVGVGWDLSFLGLTAHLERPDADVRAEGLGGWEVSDEAKTLVRAASDDWGRAAIAAGEDRAHALKAAEATRAFYSGEAPMGG
ncbi:SRPBCC family protein [Devosia sp. A8/3-2]|nr:SRPBCC family protein [Devosia sp. A8/3-2]